MMPIPTGPYPNNRPKQGDSKPERGLPLPPVTPSGATPASQSYPTPAREEDEDTFSAIPANEMGYDDGEDEEILPPTPRKNPVRPRTVEEDTEDEPDEEESHQEEENYFSSRDDDDEEGEDEVPENASPTLNLKKDPEEKRRKPERPSKPSKPSKVSRKERKARGRDIQPGITEDTFIDEDNKKLKPFGRSSQRGAKVGEFDQRKNMRSQQKAVQAIFIALAVLAVGLGLYRLIVPPKTLHEDEVLSLINASTGKNGFPQEEGGAFAQEFMKAYLSNDDSPITQRVLSYYYTGKMDGTSGNSTTQSPQGDFAQRVVYGPTIYKSLPVSAKSGSYTIGALVEPRSSQGKAPADGSAVKWMFFNVNVYYDKATNTFSIPSDSPTIVPAAASGANNMVPDPKPVSKQQPSEDLGNDTRSVVIGYIKGYATSSVQDHTALDQYVTNSKDPKLIEGLDNQFSLAGDEESSIVTKAYPTEDPSVVKVQTQVQWLSRAVGAGNAANAYTSNYVVTLTKQSNGKYLVSKFAPEYYFPTENS